MSEYHRVWQTSGLRYLLLHSSSALDSACSPLSTSSPEALAVAFVRSLPEALRFYWQRVRFPIQLIWTYWELDEDMRGKSDRSRLALWRSIMEAKHWSEEQICFWPVALSGSECNAGQNEDVRVDILVEMLRTFTPKHVLSFGERSHAALRRHFARSPGCLPEGCTIHYLPGAEDMLPDHRAAKSKTWSCIKHLTI